MRLGARVIVPRGLLFDSRKLQRAIDNALDGSARAAKADFEVTTQTWENKPDFEIDEIPHGRQITTSNQVYLWLNNGTQGPYKISSPGTLRFQANYRAKTRVRRISSGAGGSSGPVVYTREVTHPGIEARHFDEEIAKKWQREFPRNLQRAIDAEVSQ